METTPHRTPTVGPHQSGAVLVVSLLILLVMTLLGVSALSTSSLEEKMASNLQDKALAFEAAEAALREGEEFLEGVGIPAFNGTNGLYQQNALSWDTLDWTDTSAVRVYSGTIPTVALQPRYVIEELPNTTEVGESIKVGFGEPKKVGRFRITAWGVGGSRTAVAVLRTTFRR